MTLAPPDGFLVGHWTDPVGRTGCTAIVVPDGAVAGGEVRGGGPGTREMDLLTPASGPRRIQGALFTGGSAFGLAAADGMVRWLEERGHGHPTRFGVRVPLVPAAVVFDLARGSADARPDAASGYVACEAASGEVPMRGLVGAGTGCAAGKLLGPEGWAPSGIGWAAEDFCGARLCAIAVVNPVGEVVAEDGSVLAGARRPDGTPVRTADLLRAGMQPPPAREATVLVAVLTDARIDRTQAWLVARAASAGVARAVHPVATPFDGDVALCLSTATVEVDALALTAVAQDVVAAAVRDGARSALPG
jgi:L-aminopeptidase/D-esterase-like protein